MPRSVRLSVPLLSQVVYYFLVFNKVFSPRFWDLRIIAEGLASYYLGLRRFGIPKSTMHYYWRKLGGYFSSSLQLSGFYAVDETKVLLVKGKMYYLWAVRDVITGVVVYFRLSEVRSGLDVLILINGVKGIEVKKLGKELDDYFLHDGLPAYNFLSSLGVNHDHVTFGLRNLIEQVFRSVKHRLSVMDYHFPWNSSKQSITLWFNTFFLIYNLTNTFTSR